MTQQISTIVDLVACLGGGAVYMTQQISTIVDRRQIPVASVWSI